MVDSIARFIEALDRVPEVLLTVENVRVLTDARTSAGVLESIVGPPVAVVVVGATGVGKSHVVNDIVGMAASETGVLRPTTKGIVMAGSSGPAKVNHASEYVLAPDAPDGVAVMDTPAPDTDPIAVRAALAAVDIGLLVVSPSRYSDAATHELWSSMEAAPIRVVVLNRLRGSERERAAVIASAKERFADTDVFEVDEGGSTTGVRSFIVQEAKRRTSVNEKAAIARIAAAEAGRHVARALTSSSISLGALLDAVDGAPGPEISGGGLVVLESWLATERGLVELATRSVNELDRRIVDLASGDLAERMASSLGRWESGPLETKLAVWRDEAAAELRTNATIRWRRSSAEQLLDKASWKVGVNPTVQVAKRIRRMMGSRLDSVSTTVNDALTLTLKTAVEDRRSAWRAAVEDAGAFKPGELLAAVDGFEQR